MGSCCSGGDKVEPLAGKTELDSTATNKFVEDVEKNKNRSCTDIFFLILLFGFIVSLGCLIAYCGINGDPYRIINGYDKCGNICGKKNPTADANKFPCYGEDQTKKKLLLVTEAEKILFNYQNVNRECVEKCSTGYRKYLNRCVPEITSSTKNTVVSKTGIKDFFQEASEDINMSWKEILYLCIIAMTFCIVILILFRFLAGVMVWLVLVGVVIATIAGTIYLWITWKKKKDAFSGSTVNEEVNQRTVITYLVAAIIATIITVIVLLVILVMRKRIALVITLFKEAGKAIQNMPFLLFEPFLVTRWYNLFGLFWFTQFIMGCQHMVIAGAVSKWFFTRNKSSLDSPILKSFKNLVRYHLGTVAMGSLLIALVQMVRVVLTFVQNRLKGYDNSYILLASAAVDLTANTSWSSFTSLRDVVEVPPSTLCSSRMGERRTKAGGKKNDAERAACGKGGKTWFLRLPLVFSDGKWVTGSITIFSSFFIRCSYDSPVRPPSLNNFLFQHVANKSKNILKWNLSKTVKKPLELSTHLQPVIAKLGAQCLNE
uniref:Choline transporter-like protein n=1 Tax=Timema poppense TaxID=170557 RepID=A0A7R9CXI2_TIMPO|nr:unnamed protein product [Timema poppensis]